MQLFRTKRRICIDKHIGKKLHLYSIRTIGPIGRKQKEQTYTTVYLFYNVDCEHCPCSWEDDIDCGCLFDADFKVPLIKCMLPDFVKQRIRHHIDKKYHGN